MTKKLDPNEKKSRQDYRDLQKGIMAALIIESFHKRYPRLDIGKLSDEEFKKLDFGKYADKLHLYAMGYQDAIKQMNKRSVSKRSVAK